MRLGPVGQQRRPDPGAERGAADEAGQRQGARDQAPLVADRGRARSRTETMPTSTRLMMRSNAARGSGIAKRRHYLFPHGHRVAEATRAGPETLARRDRATVEHQRLRGGAPPPHHHPRAPAGRRRDARLRRRGGGRRRARTRPRRSASLDAWERGDFEAMYAELTPDARDRFSLQRFQARLRRRGDGRRRSPTSAPAR